MQMIIPALNEEGRLPETLRALRAHALAATDSGGPIDVIVVDNASTDATAEVARRLDSPAMRVRVVRCERRGKGAAVRAGVAVSTAERIGFMDADGATDLAALADAVLLLDSGADLAIGSRAVPGSVTHERHSRVRALGAAAYRAMTRAVAPGISDTQCGFKVMRGDLAREVFAQTRADGFSFDVEVVSRFQRRGARVVEFPVRWVDVAGSTFMPLRDGLPAFAALAAIAWRVRSIQPAVAPALASLPATPAASVLDPAAEL